MNKYIFLESVGEILAIEYSRFNLEFKGEVQDISLAQAKKIRSLFTSLYDHYYINDYYKDRIASMRSVFNRIEEVENCMDMLNDPENPAYIFIYQKTGLVEHILSRLGNISVGREMTEKEFNEFSLNFSNWQAEDNKNNIIRLADNYLYNVLYDLKTIIRQFADDVRWE